jgi:hypothetical protein
MDIHIYNLHEHTWEGKSDYVGRPSALGNPFVLGRDGTRKEVLDQFRKWLWDVVQTGRAGGFATPLPEGAFQDELGQQLAWTFPKADNPVLRQAAWEFLQALLARAQAGQRLNLLCHCRPRACHAETIRGALEWLALQTAVTEHAHAVE